jgi:CRISPR-associated exonuclease Cas4
MPGKLKKRTEVVLTAEDEVRITEILQDIQRIVDAATIPEVIHKSLCKKCSYYELCYV